MNSGRAPKSVNSWIGGSRKFKSEAQLVVLLIILEEHVVWGSVTQTFSRSIIQLSHRCHDEYGSAKYTSTSNILSSP